MHVSFSIAKIAILGCSLLVISLVAWWIHLLLARRPMLRPLSNSELASAAFTPDGQVLAVGLSRVQLWGVRTTRLIRQWPTATTELVKGFTFDGTMLLTVAIADSATDPNTIHLWDWRSGRLVKELKVPFEPRSPIVTSPDNKVVAGSVPEDGSIQLLEVETGKVLHVLRGYPWLVDALSFSDSGSRLVSGDGQGEVKLWDVQTGKLLRSIQCPPLNPERGPTGVFGLAFLSGSDTLVIVSEDSTWRLWDGGERFLRVRKGNRQLRMVSFAYSSRFYVTGQTDLDVFERYHGSVFLYDGLTGKELAHLTSGLRQMGGVAVTHDGNTVAVGAQYGSGETLTKLWDIQK